MNGHSEYYPPRARGLFLFRRSWFALRRILPIESLNIQRERLTVSPGNILLSLLLPSYIFHVLGWRRVALLVASVYFLAFCAHIFWVGYYTSALVIMLSIHVTSAAYLVKQLAPNFGLALRLLSSFALFVFFYSFVYQPFNSRLAKTVIPMRVGKNIVFVNCLASPKTIQRGDWIAYRIKSGNAGAHNAAIAIHEGFGISPTLGIAGDTVRFSPNQIEINGKIQSRENYMPTNGEWVISEKQWFVWPKVAIGGNRAAADGQISAVLQERALISEKEFVGKPFKHWFGKRQILP